MALVRLEGLNLERLTGDRQVPFMRDFSEDMGRHLTQLAVHVGGGACFTTPCEWSNQANAAAKCMAASLVACLPELRELVLVVGWPAGITEDLRGLINPPRGLTSLVAQTHGSLHTPDLLLSPALMAGLVSLTVSNLSPCPPLCLRGTGGSYARLTRLAYGRRDQIIDWGAWCSADYCIPTLVEMKAIGKGFTMTGVQGRVWAEAVASTTLPRLSRLVLCVQLPGSRAAAFYSTPDCSAADLELTLRDGLPTACTAVGRRIVVSVHTRGSLSIVPYLDRLVWGKLQHTYAYEPRR